MSQKPIIKTLLDIYNDTFVICDLFDPDEVHKYLIKNNLYFGLCWASKHNIGIDIGDEYWIINNCAPGKSYWYRCPSKCKYKPEILTTLKFRIEKLKSLL